MAFITAGREALCGGVSISLQSPMLFTPWPSLSSTFRYSRPSAPQRRPLKCRFTEIKTLSISTTRRTVGRNGSWTVCNCTPSADPFSSNRNNKTKKNKNGNRSNNAEISPSSWKSNTPWEDALNSFVVDVVAADARPLNVPLLAPFTIATTKLEKVRNVAIRVTLEDGSVGWGETPTLPPVTAEDQPLAFAKASQACSFLTAQPGLSLRELLLQISYILPGHRLASVRAGIEMAVVDAVAHSLKLPLWKFFGGHCSSITTDITIPICSPEEGEDLAGKYAARGFATIKTKVGGRVLSSDIALLKAIRRGHPSCSLIMDANCGYTGDEALQVLQELHDLGLTPSLFEQPVVRDDWTGLGHVSRIARELYGVPVAADESCRSLSDAKQIVEEGLAEVVNVKLVKMGVLEALEVVTLVREAGLELMIGGMVETRLAMGFAAHLAGGLGCFRFVDLDTPLLLAEDPVQGGYKVDGAVYLLSEDYGHGGRVK